MTTNRTPSGKLNRIIEQAEALGLVVEVEQDLTTCFEWYHVTIKRPRIEPVEGEFTMLDYYHNSRAIWINASRSTFGTSAKAFSLDVTYYCGAVEDSQTKVPPTRTRYYVEMLAEGLAS